MIYTYVCVYTRTYIYIYTVYIYIYILTYFHIHMYIYILKFFLYIYSYIIIYIYIYTYSYLLLVSNAWEMPSFLELSVFPGQAWEVRDKGHGHRVTVTASRNEEVQRTHLLVIWWLVWNIPDLFATF